MTLVDSKPSVDHPGNLRFMIRLNSDQCFEILNPQTHKDSTCFNQAAEKETPIPQETTNESVPDT